MKSMKRQKIRTMKDELSRLVGAQYATGDQWRNNSRKNEETEPKQKQHPPGDVTGDGSKVQCCKEQYCIGNWNVRSMNQGKLEMNRDHSVVFEIASKYCILDSFVDYDVYSISSKGFLPTVVDTMVI